jgi:predicted nuclease of predicted toxin-antitoxin system
VVTSKTTIQLVIVGDDLERSYHYKRSTSATRARIAGHHRPEGERYEMDSPFDEATDQASLEARGAGLEQPGSTRLRVWHLELRDDIRALGHEADTVPDEGLMGAPDSVLLERARDEDRVLLTMDKGIADVRRYPPRLYAGIVLFRPGSTGRGEVLAFVRRQLPSVLAWELKGWLLIVGERSIRLR